MACHHAAVGVPAIPAGRLTPTRTRTRAGKTRLPVWVWATRAVAYPLPRCGGSMYLLPRTAALSDPRSVTFTTNTTSPLAFIRSLVVSQQGTVVALPGQ